MWHIFKYSISEVSFNFRSSPRRGRGALHVMIAGSGRRPSTLMRGGGPDGVALGDFRNVLLFCEEVDIGGAN